MTAYDRIRAWLDELEQERRTAVDERDEARALSRDLRRRVTALEDERSSALPWHVLHEAIPHLLDEASRGMRVGERDQLAAVLRSAFVEIEVPFADETTIFFGFVWAGMLVELARNGYRNGYLEESTFRAIAELAATIGATLAPLTPPAARPAPVDVPDDLSELEELDDDAPPEAAP